MVDAILNIPDDLAACQALVRELSATVNELQSKNQQLVNENAELQLTIEELMRRGHRRERYIEDPGQLTLNFGAIDTTLRESDGLPEAVDTPEIVVEGHTRRKKGSKQPRDEQLPAHLPRYEVKIETPDDVKTCPTHGERTFLDYDRVETLEFERPQLRVRVTLIPKYVCANHPTCGVSEPTRPEGLVEGARYDTSIAAEITTCKYAYHLPVYRQEDWFAGSGWSPGRSTLLNILRATSERIEPLIDHWRGEVIRSGLIGTDETRVTLLLPPTLPTLIPGDPKSERIHEVFANAMKEGKPSVSARIWAYRSISQPLNVFDFTVSRHRDGPDVFLLEGGFTGTLMADCFSGYQGLELRSDSRIVRAACVAHARRKVFESRESYPLLSSQLLSMFQQIYDVEDRARNLTPAEREMLRNAEARPVWRRMRELLDSDTVAGVLPKDKFAEALGYLRRNWDALQVYLSDGRLPIDNNDVEQLMKQIATGRKNWLFVGSVAAGERAANLMSLVSSAVRSDLDVWAYTKDVLDNLLAGSTDYDALRPDRWAANHPEFVRAYRQEERRNRADAKRTRRQERRARANQRSN